jgi:PAS domain S-box-containing protein
VLLQDATPMVEQRTARTQRKAHVSSHTTHDARSLWRLVNTPLPLEPRAMRLGCTIFLVVYAIIAGARYHESHAFFWLRLLVCCYAAFGIWLSRRVTWTVARAYAVGLALLLPLQAAYVDGILGNHLPELAISALASFAGIVFIQTGIDLVLTVPALIAGHALVLAVVPSPAVPWATVAVMLGGAIATATAVVLYTLIYRARWTDSLVRLGDALATSAEWKNRYEAAIVASGQVLYDWDPRIDEVQFAGATERMLGYSKDELSGALARWIGLLHPDDLEAFECEVARVLTEKAPFQMRYRVRHKDGAHVIVESHGHFLLDERHEIVRMIGFLTDVTERTRAETERAEEAAISSALARVGHELISSLETPVVLERLCRLTTEVLACDFSTTWLWKADDGVFTAIASDGLSTEQWDAMRVLRMPSDRSAPLFTRLLEDDFVEVAHDSTTYPLVASMLEYYGARVVLCVALRRGGEIVGIHAAGCLWRGATFTSGRERIARGIGQLASMALTNATLVEKLERADRLKSEFVSTMSHELRTPLNVVLGYTDILADDIHAPEQRAHLARIRQSSLELLEMIEATLNVNRLAAGKDLPQIERLPLAALWDDLRSEFDALPCPADVVLRWEPVGDAVLRTDRRKLKIIVKNLVGNALKFTPAGEIVVRCERQDDATVISVRDTGIGIPADHLTHIFDMFRQVDSSDARSYGGTGLGLYIVRQLVDQLGGVIEVESAPGHGSAFRVRLPTAPASSADVAA